MTRNEAQEAINAVLHDVEECKDQDFVNEIYKLTTQTVRKLPDQERLWFRVAMRYCELCYRRGDVKECQLHLDELLKSCQNPDGSDDPSKSGLRACARPRARAGRLESRALNSLATQAPSCWRFTRSTAAFPSPRTTRCVSRRCTRRPRTCRPP